MKCSSDNNPDIHTHKFFTSFRPDFTSKLVHGLVFGIPKSDIAPYDKINHGLVNLSCNYVVKSGLTLVVSK